LTASDGAAGDYFGESVAVSGNIVVVGAVRDQVGSNSQQGSAYIYKLNPSTNTWAETKQTASDGAASDQFGNSIALSGNTLVVGAHSDNSSQGSAYIYKLR
jgi:N-acetylneuraminic acid mutarotase